jgi:hypothetical protein
MTIETVREISRYYADRNIKSYASVKYDIMSDIYWVEYYDADENLLVKELYPGKSLQFIEDAAENWALGIKKEFSGLMERLKSP